MPGSRVRTPTAEEPMPSKRTGASVTPPWRPGAFSRDEADDATFSNDSTQYHPSANRARIRTRSPFVNPTRCSEPKLLILPLEGSRT